MTDEAEARARILASFGVTEEDIAALDPDGSYAASVTEARRQEEAFRERARALSLAVSDALTAFVIEHGRYPSEPEIRASVDAALHQLS